MLQKLLTLAVQVIPILLLILSGWGLDDLHAFFGHPARAGLIAAVLLGCIAALVLGIDVRPIRKGRLHLGHQTIVLLALALASVFLLWFLPFADDRGILVFANSQPVRYFGLLLCCCGIMVRLLALRKLGRQFSAYVTLQEEHELVQSGIYRHIRHPLYLSLLLAGPGFALVFASRLTFPILLITLIFVTRRIRQEENLLASHFGRAFIDYATHTWILIPLVI